MKCKWHLCEQTAVTPGGYCGVKCKNKYNVTVLMHRTKRALVQYAGGKCRQCGYDNCDAALVFHHRDPASKDFAVAGNSHRYKTMEELKAEVDKCDLLCSNCHMETHYSRRSI